MKTDPSRTNIPHPRDVSGKREPQAATNDPTDKGVLGMRTARTHLRSIAVATLLVAVVALAPASSQAASGAVYSVKGTLTVQKTSWSMSGTVTLVRGAGKLPKTGTLSATGKTGVIIGPLEIGATTGALKITWSAGPQPEPPTKATVVHAMTHPIHTLTGPISSGFGKAGVIIIWLQHKNSGSFTGQVGITIPWD